MKALLRFISCMLSIRGVGYIRHNIVFSVVVQREGFPVRILCIKRKEATRSEGQKRPELKTPRFIANDFFLPPGIGEGGSTGIRSPPAPVRV